MEHNPFVVDVDEESAHVDDQLVGSWAAQQRLHACHHHGTSLSRMP